VDIIADEGISGFSIKNRPGVQQVLSMVQKKKIDAIIIFKLDRLARNVSETLEIATLMDKKGVALHSISEKLDTKSAFGKFFFTILAAIAEMERGLISERVKAVMDLKREKNEKRNNNPPYGYRAEGKLLVTDLQEQMNLQRIHELRSEGYTIKDIIEELTQEGIFNRKNKPFTWSQVYSLTSRKAA
jgi:site-specific DNA recombinase